MSNWLVAWFSSWSVAWSVKSRRDRRVPPEIRSRRTSHEPPGPQPLPGSEIALDLVEPAALPGGHGGDHLAAQRRGAVVDVVERAIACRFLVAHHPLAVGDDVRGVPRAGVAVDCHHAVTIGVAVERGERRAVVERQVAIAVGHDERRRQDRERRADRARGPEQRTGAAVALDRPRDAHAVLRTVADVVADLVAEVGDAHQRRRAHPRPRAARAASRRTAGRRPRASTSARSRCADASGSPGPRRARQLAPPLPTTFAVSVARPAWHPPATARRTACPWSGPRTRRAPP